MVVKTKLCVRCSRTLDIRDFYVISKQNAHGKAVSTYCKQCCIKQKMDRVNRVRHRIKSGQKCVVCGYSKYAGALDFHHLDPSSKDVNVSELLAKSNTSFIPKLVDELKKCVVVCRNCHAEIHGNVTSIPQGTKTYDPPADLTYSVTDRLQEIKSRQRTKNQLATHQRRVKEESKKELIKAISSVTDRSWGWKIRTAKQLGISHTQVSRLLKVARLLNAIENGTRGRDRTDNLIVRTDTL